MLYQVGQKVQRLEDGALGTVVIAREEKLDNGLILDDVTIDWHPKHKTYQGVRSGDAESMPIDGVQIV